MNFVSALRDESVQPRWAESWYSDVTKLWFRERGYRLFKYRVFDPSVLYADENDERHARDEDTNERIRLEESPYPYAYHSKTLNATLFLNRCSPHGPVAFGQDSQNRPVAIKFVEGGSEEYKIFRLIQSLDLNETLEWCIIPVLEFIPFDDHWFVVMPMWTRVYPHENCGLLRDVMNLMHDMLKALTFLHKHKIFHRDIKLDNFVYNFLPNAETSFYHNPTYKSLLFDKEIRYAIIDFGVSIKFPEDASPQQCRLPYWHSWIGSYFLPDTAQGEFDFDPFAYDVGILGYMFSEYFQHLTPQAPMLAPLLDKMITRNVQKRFTASEALQFFEEMHANLTEEQLQAPIDLQVYTLHYEEYDRWAGLPEDFIKQWGKYREPPLPLSTKIMRAICSSHPWISYSVRWIWKRFHSSRMWFMHKSI